MDKQGASSPSRAANERIWCSMKITLFHSKFQINTRAAYDDCHRAIIFGNENSCREKDSNGGGDSLKNLSSLSNTRWATTFFNMVPFCFLMGKIIYYRNIDARTSQSFPLTSDEKTLLSKIPEPLLNLGGWVHSKERSGWYGRVPGVPLKYRTRVSFIRFWPHLDAFCFQGT